MNNLILLVLVFTGFVMLIIANVSAFAPSPRSKPNFVYLQETLIAY